MKKILVQTGQGANQFIRQSLVNAWRAIGDSVYFWDDSGKSPFDVFGEFEPDIFLSSTWQLTRAITKCLYNRPNVKVVLYADMWGKIQTSLDLVQYPVGVATDEQKRLVDLLEQIPYLVSNHSQKYIEDTHGGWRNLGCTPESLLVSADTTQYYPRCQDDNYKVQLFYCGGSWGYKNNNIDKYLMPLLYPTTRDWRIRIAGGGWNVVQSIGRISVEEESRHYTNADIIPHMVEPHCSDLWSDWPLRYFQVPACGGFGISCPCVGIRDVFTEEELIVADNREDFFDKVVYYLNNPEETIPFRQKAKEKVLLNHTGFHRIKQIFEMISEDTTIVDRMISAIAFDLTGK